MLRLTMISLYARPLWSSHILRSMFYEFFAMQADQGRSDTCVTPVFSLTLSLPLPLPPLEVVSSVPEAEGTPVSTTVVDLHPWWFSVQTLLTDFPLFPLYQGQT